MIKKIVKSKLAMIGLFAVVLLLLSAVFAPWIAPHDPYKQDLLLELQPPGKEYLFGTDEYGRCLFCRILWGGRVSLLTGVLASLCGASAGICLGLLAGFSGGFIDRIIMGISNVFMAFPGLIMSLAIAGILGPSVTSTVIALASVGWMGIARVVRAKVLSEREKEYVLAAKFMGASPLRMCIRHLLPGVLPSVIVLVGSGVGRNILAAASLSFLGVGVSPPTAEWGYMLSEGKMYLYQAEWLTVYPGMAILCSVLAFNTLGEGLRKALDPVSRRISFFSRHRKRIRRYSDGI